LRLPQRLRIWPSAAVVPTAMVILLVSLVEMGDTLSPSRGWPRPLLALDRAAAPFRTVNSYGLFAVMTTTRPEIIVEGSRDGERWEPYEFRWKPGLLSRAPRLVAPHQPRLDWQMWFAALGDYRSNPWFLSFLQRLLQGSPDVIALVRRDPFPNAPPRYVRAVVYDYRFTHFDQRRETGHWWKRNLLGLYCPVLTLTDGQLAPAAMAAPLLQVSAVPAVHRARTPQFSSPALWPAGLIAFPFRK
jgi:Lipase maturation factor